MEDVVATEVEVEVGWIDEPGERQARFVWLNRRKQRKRRQQVEAQPLFSCGAVLDVLTFSVMKPAYSTAEPKSY